MDFDLINALFELGGAALLTLNIRRLLIDRTIKGVSVWPTAFFSLWGVWNLFFYAAVNTPLSWWAGLLLCAVNAIWLIGVLGLHLEAKHAEAKLKELIAQNRPEHVTETVVGQPELQLGNEMEAAPDCSCGDSGCANHSDFDLEDLITPHEQRVKAETRAKWRAAKRKQRAKAKKKKGK